MRIAKDMGGNKSPVSKMLCNLAATRSCMHAWCFSSGEKKLVRVRTFIANRRQYVSDECGPRFPQFWMPDSEISLALAVHVFASLISWYHLTVHLQSSKTQQTVRDASRHTDTSGTNWPPPSSLGIWYRLIRRTWMDDKPGCVKSYL